MSNNKGLSISKPITNYEMHKAASKFTAPKDKELEYHLFDDRTMIAFKKGTTMEMVDAFFDRLRNRGKAYYR